MMIPSIMGEAKKAPLTKSLRWRSLYLNLCEQSAFKAHILIGTGCLLWEDVGGIPGPSIWTVLSGRCLQHYIVNGSSCSYAVLCVCACVLGQIEGGTSVLNFAGKGQEMTNKGHFTYRGMGSYESMACLDTWNYFIMTKVKDEAGWLRAIAKRWDQVGPCAISVLSGFIWI